MLIGSGVDARITYVFDSMDTRHSHNTRSFMSVNTMEVQSYVTAFTPVDKEYEDKSLKISYKN